MSIWVSRSNQASTTAGEGSTDVVAYLTSCAVGVSLTDLTTTPRNKSGVSGQLIEELTAGGPGRGLHSQRLTGAEGKALARPARGSDRSEKSGVGYTYFWTCLSCGVVRTRDEFSPPELWSIDPETTEYVPGSFPPLAIWNPYVWLDGSGLPAQDIALAREGWSSLAEFGLRGEDPAIGRSAVLEAEAEARYPFEPLIEAVRIELEADPPVDPPGHRMLVGPGLWERADAFMQEVAKPIRDDDMWGRNVNYRVAFADGHVLDSSTRQYADDQASLSRKIRRECLTRYQNNLRSQPEDIQKFADADRAFLSRYKLGPGRHEANEVAEKMFTAPQTPADIRNVLDMRRNRLHSTARVRRFENAPEPIRVGAAALKLAAGESVCEALEGKDPVRRDQANEAMVRLGRLDSYVPSFEIRDHSTLQEGLESAGAVISAYEMMHTADTPTELRSDEERLAKALEAWHAHLEASRA